jgi:hypothetical protein
VQSNRMTNEQQAFFALLAWTCPDTLCGSVGADRSTADNALPTAEILNELVTFGGQPDTTPIIGKSRSTRRRQNRNLVKNMLIVGVKLRKRWAVCGPLPLLSSAMFGLCEERYSDPEHKFHFAEPQNRRDYADFTAIRRFGHSPDCTIYGDGIIFVLPMAASD